MYKTLQISWDLIANLKWLAGFLVKYDAIWSGLCWDVSSSKYVIILVGFLPVGTGSIPRFMQDRHGRQICQVSIQLKVNDTMDLGENMTDDVTPCRGCFLLGNIYIVENSCPQYFQFSFSVFFRVFEIWWNMFDSPRWRCKWVIPLNLKHSLPQGSSQDTNRHHRVGTSLSDSPGVWLQLHVSWQR